MGLRKSNPPSSTILMNSLRQMGYTFESALADIIDNSITANATLIDIDFPSNPTVIYVSIIDNGVGMDYNELFQAMKYGSKSSLDNRSSTDLGRFGLGLKLASLSLCRVLTVISKKSNRVCGMRWNLNNMDDDSDWCIEELTELEIECTHNISKLHANSTGTLVLWEDFDFLKKISGGRLFNELTEKLADSIFHLSLVFHRFLQKPFDVSILINSRRVEPLDPFLSNHKKTRILRSPEDLIITDDNDIERKIRIEAIVLPFQNDLTLQDIQKLGGIERLRSMQGFYVYRNDRLIIWSTWFKMKPESELTKYARIKVDIPSSLDNIWQIDIRKSNALLPSKIRTILCSYVEEVMNTSVRKSTHRTVLKNKDISHLWETHENRDKKIVFKVNRRSTVYKILKNHVTEKDMEYFEDFIEYIEKSLPYHDLYVEVANGNISQEVDDYEKDRLIAGSKQFLDIFKKLNPELNQNELITQVCSIEPFSKYLFIKQELEKSNAIK